MPFTDLNETQVILEVVGGNTPNHLLFPKSCPEQLIIIAQQCWNVDPSERPTWQELLAVVESLAEL